MKFKLIFLFILTSNAFAQGMSPNVDPNKFTICAITINSDNEKKLFEAQTKKYPKKFNPVVELTSLGDEQNWFDNACASNIQCDQLVISGHFAGEFFGDNNDLSISLEELEKKSCSKSCEGILGKPYEVFLFGCNTLAGKEEDHRTPEQYLQVLLNDGFAAREAAMIVESRYGSVGASNKARMQRAFKGEKKQLYGFDSVGPSGKTVESFLKRYFQAHNPAEHLEKQMAKRMMDKLEMSNKLLATSLKGTAFVQCEAREINDNETRIICGLKDDTVSVKDRLSLVIEAFGSEDHLNYFPSIAEFFAAYPISYMDEESKEVMLSLHENKTIRDQIIGMVKNAKTLTLASEWADFAVNAGFMTSVERNEKLGPMILDIMKQDVSEADAEIICDIGDVAQIVDLKIQHIKKSKLSEHDLIAIGCLESADIRVQRRLAPMLKDNDPYIRALAAQALGHKRVSDQSIVAELAKLMDDSESWVAMEAIRHIGETEVSDKDVIEKISGKLKASDPGIVIETAHALSKLNIRSPEIEANISKLLESDYQANKEAALTYFQTIPPADLKNREKVCSLISDPEHGYSARFAIMMNAPSYSDELVKKAIISSAKENHDLFNGMRLEKDKPHSIMEVINLATSTENADMRRATSRVLEESDLSHPDVRSKIVETVKNNKVIPSVEYAFYWAANKDETLKKELEELIPSLEGDARLKLRSIIGK